MGLKDNLVSWWTLDETSGTRVDSHGTNDLTDNATVLYGTGKKGNAADFETSNSEFLSKTDTADLSFTGDFSWAGWINLESLTVNQCIVGKWNTSGENRSYAFFISTGAKLRSYISSDGTNAGTTKIFFTQTGFSTATWYHLAVAYDASAGTMDYWINGAAQTQLTGHNTSVYDSTASFGLGNSFGDFAYFDGLIDEFAVWNRLIDGTDVSALYNGGDGLTYSEIDSGSTPTNSPFLAFM